MLMEFRSMLVNLMLIILRAFIGFKLVICVTCMIYTWFKVLAESELIR